MGWESGGSLGSYASSKVAANRDKIVVSYAMHTHYHESAAEHSTDPTFMLNLCLIRLRLGSDAVKHLAEMEFYTKSPPTKERCEKR